VSTSVEPTIEQGRFVGTSVQRVEDPRLLQGLGHYIDDLVLPGMLHAAFVRSPIARAKIRSIDTSAAESLPGVIAVWTGADLNDDTAPLDYSPQVPGGWGVDVRVLAGDDVRFVGDPIAIVIAADRYVAEDGCELVDVDYEALPPVIGRQTALTTSELVHPGAPSNLAWSAASEADEDLEAAFAASDRVFTETFRQHRQCNVPMEPRGIVADWDRGSRSMTIHISSQNPHADRMFFSRVLNLAENHVRVIMRDVGGGFGQKIARGRDETAVAVAAKRLGRPVKWIEDRQENLTASNHARDEEMTVRLGVSADGILKAAHISYLADMGAYPLVPGLIPGMIAVSMFPGPYRLPHYGWSGRSVYTNTCGLAAYRGPWMMETTARESMLDIVARELGIDPAQLRRQNLIGPDELPYTTSSGNVYDRISSVETFELALETIDYVAFRTNQRSALAEGRFLGIGISTYIEPTAGGGLPFAFEAATVRVEASGKVNLLMGTGSQGHSLETTMVQVVADQLGVTLDDVVLLQGDTSVAPAGGGTVGSRSAVAGGGAARLAAAKVREKALAIAAHRLDVPESDLVIEDGRISVAGAAETSITFAEVARIASTQPAALPAGMEPGLEHTSRYGRGSPTYADTTQVCSCEVDVVTGEVRLLDYVVSGDCGVIINPMVVEGQITGGVAQGIGGVLLEHMPYDSDGNPLAITFKDYLMPTTDTVPDVRHAHIETPSDTPGGHKGVGEGGAIGAPAAVFNAVADALAPLGVRLTDQPLDPSRLLAAIGARTLRPTTPDR
jgi:carbon-monoxide dehydrogenase large subunit